jgi:glycosyltransferase involved in cell wall biosynthesis
MPKVLIYIPKELSLGGLRQLLFLLSVRQNGGAKITLFANRVVLEKIPAKIDLVETGPLWILNEIKISFLSKRYDELVCFSNLPTLFPSYCNQVVFLQNRHLLGKSIINGMGLKLYFKTFAQRLFLRWFIRNSNILVQTPTMAFYVHKIGVPYERIQILSKSLLFPNSNDSRYKVTEPTFFYPASNDPHKNVSLLIEAWKLLESGNVKAKLVVTLSRSQLNLDTIKPYIEAFNVEFLGQITEMAVESRIKAADFLIFPSLFESFGYSLYDALKMGTPIICSESSYVYDICSPEMTFDPRCAFSIARTVARAAGQENIFMKHLFINVKEFN